MTATVNELIDQMAAQVTTAMASVTDVDVQVVAFHLAEPSPPTVDMYVGDPGRGSEMAAFGEEGELLVTVRVRVPSNDPEQNQRHLNDFLDDTGDKSVALALMDDPTLNGLAQDIFCDNPTGLLMYPYGSELLPGRQFTCRVVRVWS